MEKKGATRICTGEFSDKWQITALYVASVSDGLLPIQLIYQGLTNPDYLFPPHLHIMCPPPTHWSNEETVLEYVDNYNGP